MDRLFSNFGKGGVRLATLWIKIESQILSYLKGPNPLLVVVITKNPTRTIARMKVIIRGKTIARMALPVVISWSWRIPIISVTSDHITAIMFIMGSHPNNKEAVDPYMPAFIVWVIPFLPPAIYTKM